MFDDSPMNAKERGIFLHNVSKRMSELYGVDINYAENIIKRSYLENVIKNMPASYIGHYVYSDWATEVWEDEIANPI